MRYIIAPEFMQMRLCVTVNRYLHYWRILKRGNSALREVAMSFLQTTSDYLTKMMRTTLAGG